MAKVQGAMKILSFSLTIFLLVTVPGTCIFLWMEIVGHTYKNMPKRFPAITWSPISLSMGRPSQAENFLHVYTSVLHIVVWSNTSRHVFPKTFVVTIAFWLGENWLQYRCLFLAPSINVICMITIKWTKRYLKESQQSSFATGFKRSQNNMTNIKTYVRHTHSIKILLSQ